MSKILMLTSEATPFASTGGLGDVLQGLPIALREAGHDVAILLPLYAGVRAFSPENTHRTLNFSIGPHPFKADIYKLEAQGVTHYLLDIPALYNRPGIYGNGAGDYPDNHLRFGALARGALAIAETLFLPEVIHCHDWPAALLPILLRERLSAHPGLASIKTVFTIHNLAFQGCFPKSAVADLGLGLRLAASSAICADGTVGFLQGALLTSDVLTTVSPTYARQIQTPDAGCGLENILRSRAADLHGIANGIDLNLWNPETDPHLPVPFSAASLAGKRACKLALLQQAGLPAELIDKPLIGVVARLTPQKGYSLLMRRPHDFMALGASLIVHGSGDLREEDFFRWLASAYPKRVSVQIGYDTALAHRVLGASDLFLMPSLYEPCGLAQLYAMRYGTLPLVHATGGLNDTVTEQTGFRFVPHTAEAFLACLRAALPQWETPAWQEKQSAAMNEDHSWSKVAALYSSVYRQVLDS